jgi:hypothetical protein
MLKKKETQQSKGCENQTRNPTTPARLEKMAKPMLRKFFIVSLAATDLLQKDTTNRNVNCLIWKSHHWNKDTQKPSILSIILCGCNVRQLTTCSIWRLS